MKDRTSWKIMTLFVFAILAASLGTGALMAAASAHGKDGGKPGGSLEDRGSTIHVDAENGDDDSGDGSAGNPYRTIQKGVDEAEDDDSVVVHPGNYTEFIEVGKRLSIKSSTGNPDVTNVTGPDWKDWVFHVTSDWVNISGLRITGTSGGLMGGIFLDAVSFCNISSNNITDNAKGVRMDDATHISIYGNTIDSNGNEGVYVIRASHNTFGSNVIRNNSIGLYIFTSSHVSISGNRFSSNYYGMDLNYLSDPAIVQGNTVEGNRARGIEIDKCDGLAVEGNTIRDNPDYGLYLVASENCRIANNTLDNDPHDLGIYPHEKADFYHTIDTSNTVHGLPIYYWTGEENRTIPDDAGFVGLIDCANITVEDLDLDGVTSHGIMLVGSVDCTVADNEVSDVRDHAIYLGYGSERNTVSGNVIRNDPTKPTYGITLFRSANNEIFDNDIKLNWYGIRLEESPDNTVFSNTANENSYGFFIYSNSDNTEVRDNFAGWNKGTGIHLQLSEGMNVSGNECESNGNYGIALYQCSQNRISWNTLRHNTKYDLYISEYKAYSDGYFDNLIVNNTGSGDRPILYFNTSVNLEGKKLSELILCDADNSIIQNVTIMGSDIRRNNGLVVLGTENSEFINIDSSGSWYGMYLGWSYDNVIRDSSFDDCDENGIRFYDLSERNVVENCTMNSNDVSGIFIYGGKDNTVANCTVNSNGREGLLVFFSSGNEVSGNTVRDNTNWGIHLGASGDNLIYNNYFSNSHNAQDDRDNDWNIEKTRGMNIVGGQYLGGNFWSDYTGNDTDGDWLGNTGTPHDSGGNIQNGGDDLPLLVPTRVLSIRKTVDRDRARPGDLLNYTITVTNIWKQNVTNVTVREIYDEGVDFQYSDPVPSLENDTWFFERIPVNGSETINVTVRLNGTLRDGRKVTNLVEATSEEGGTVSDSAVTRITAPVLWIIVTDDPDPVEAGQLLNYTIEIANTGSAGVADVRVTETYDGNVTLVSASPWPSGGDNVWTFPALNASEMKTIKVSVHVDGGLPDGTVVSNFAEVNCSEGMYDSDEEFTTVFVEQPGAYNVSLTIDEIAGGIEPGASINVSGSITIQPGEAGGAVRSVEVYLDGVHYANAAFTNENFTGTLLLPSNLTGGNHTIMVEVLLMTGEYGTGNRTIRYEPGTVRPTITITIDDISGAIEPGAALAVSGNISIEPAEPGVTITGVKISLDGSEMTAADLNGSRFTGTFMLPGNLTEGNHTITVNVTLDTGEGSEESTGIVYEKEQPHVHTITITIDEMADKVAPGAALTVSGIVVIEPAAGIRSIRVFLDGVEVATAARQGIIYSGSFTLPEGLAEGNHTITVNVTLPSGESAAEEKKFRYEPADDGKKKEDDGDGGGGTWVILGLMIVFVLIALGVGFFVYRKNHDQREAGRIEKIMETKKEGGKEERQVEKAEKKKEEGKKEKQMEETEKKEGEGKAGRETV